MTYLSFQRLKHRVLDILKNAFIIKDEPPKMKNDNFEHLDLTLGILKFCHWDVLFMVSYKL
jgi:hypothetical protein